MISAVLIVRDEAANIVACLESIRPHVDEIVLVDTGSTDGTAELARQLVDRIESFTWCDDFSKARNFAWQLVSHPWVLWLDGDDVLRGGEKLRKLCADMDAKRGTQQAAILLPYEYSRDETGAVTLLQYRERLVTPGTAFEWRGAVHETLHPLEPCVMERMTEPVVAHRPTAGKVPDATRNLRILRAAWEGGDQSPRTLYYLALELGKVGDIGASIQHHRRYVELSTWDDERALSCLELSRHYCSVGDFDQAIKYGQAATLSREGWLEGYLAVGRAYYFLGMRGGPEERRHWERAVHWLELGLRQRPTESVLFVNPLDRSHHTHEFLNVALAKLGHIDKALTSCEVGLQARHSESMAENAKEYRAMLARSEVERGLSMLSHLGRIRVQTAAEVRNLIDYEPRGKVIHVFTGNAPAPWTPETAARDGIGGSETAVIEMTKRWAAAGHQVAVYGDCKGMEGTYEGVEYRHWERIRGATCDVLVASRRPDVLDEGIVAATLRILWVHDIHMGDLLTHQRALQAHRVMALSEWHRECILHHHPQIHREQVTVTRNGIDLSRYTERPHRNLHRVIYSSSPDRGIASLLAAWPEIRAQVPDAELDIYYGFETWEAMNPNDERIEPLKQAIAWLEPMGVTMRGRVSQKELARAQLSAGVWAYPTWFSETSCITAMEAQAAGMRIVTTPIAALVETLGGMMTITETFGCGNAAFIDDPEWMSREFQAELIQLVVGAMTWEEDGGRERLMERAKRFDWGTVAAEWLEMFDAYQAPMPPYVGYAG